MAPQTAGQIVNVMKEERLFPAAGRFRRPGPHRFAATVRADVAARRPPTWKVFGANWPASCTGSSPIPKCWSGASPWPSWFVGGQTNVSYNCLDVHLGTPRRDKPALIWEGEPGEVRVLSYQMLHAEVCKFANVLKGLGIGRGDVVAIYMPLVPELAIAMLACAGSGRSIRSFSAASRPKRWPTATTTPARRCKSRPTAPGGGASRSRSRKTSTQALAKSPTVQKCIVLRRTGAPVAMKPGPRLLVARTDGRRLGRLPRRAAGQRNAAVHPLHQRLDRQAQGSDAHHGRLQPLRQEDHRVGVRHSRRRRLLVYGRHRLGHRPQLRRLRPALGGGDDADVRRAPNWPDEGRFWEIIQRHRVTIFYTAPTAIRSFIKWGDHWLDGRDLSSLRLLGTVGEGINPEAWMWYHRMIGGGRCPIVDTWWQTETGGIMISPLPGAIATKPGSCTKPLPGVLPEIVGEDGRPVDPGKGGWLVITRPWPGMIRGIWGDDGSLQAAILEPGARQVPLRRQRPLRRRRLLLDHGPHRRRAQRLRPPAEHDRDRKRAGEPPGGGRGGGRGPSRTS